MDKRYLIEHILHLMNFLQLNNLTLERLMELDEQGCLSSDDPDLRKACEIIRFMDEMPGGFLIYFANTNEEIVYANKALLRIFQCPTMQEFRDWTQNSFQGLVFPDDLDEVEKSIYEQIANSQYNLDYVEYRIRRKDGAIRWIEDYGHFIHCDEQRDVFYVFLSDATDKHDQLEDILHSAWQSAEEMRSLIETYDRERALINQKYLRQLEMIQGLSINYESIFYADLDTDTIVPYRNSSRTEKFFPKDSQSAFSTVAVNYVNTWVFREDQQLVLDAFSPGHIRERLAGCDTYYVNYRAVYEGKTEYLQLRIVKAGSSTSRIVVGCQKVDEEIRREMEQRQLLSEALENANLAIVAKDTFLSNMSHDMRTPLNGILGYLNLAKNSLNDPAALREYLDGAANSGRQMQRLIDEVLEIAWNDSNEVKTKETDCDLCALTEEAVAALRPRAEGKRISLTLDDASVVHSAVYGRPEKLKQMISAITSNAVIYTNPGGHVSVTLSERPGLSEQYAAYQLEVTDTGIGMSKEFLQHIYEPFTRERNTTGSGVPGSGLGLTIVKKIVDRLGGNIDVESTPGKGTSFMVTFPLRLRAAAPVRTAAGPVKLAGRGVLLVDDNDINLKIENKIFESLGFRVDTALEGYTAVEKVRNSRPGDYDLVLMDLQMPGMDGWQAARAIRGLDNPALAGIPIIALSANAFQGDIRKSIESGMDAHLTKPIDVPTLVNKVSDVLRCKTRR